jgi:hypothetical protein
MMLRFPRAGFIAILICLILTAMISTGVAQDDQPIVVTSKVQFEVTEDLCPSPDECWSLWDISPSGNYLFVYFQENHWLGSV